MKLYREVLLKSLAVSLILLSGRSVQADDTDSAHQHTNEEPHSEAGVNLVLMITIVTLSLAAIAIGLLWYFGELEPFCRNVKELWFTAFPCCKPRENSNPRQLSSNHSAGGTGGSVAAEFRNLRSGSGPAAKRMATGDIESTGMINRPDQ